MSSVEVEVFTEGSGSRRVLLIHGSASGARPMLRLGKALAATWPELKIESVSLAGYGSRVTKPDLPVLEQHLAVLAAVVGDTPCHLLGHSMGGFLALQAALRLPERIQSLSLIEPMAFGVLDPQLDASALAFDADVLEAFAVARQSGSGISHFIEAWNQTAWHALPDHVRRKLSEQEDQVFSEASAVSKDRTTLTAYRALPMPILLLAGSESPLPVQRILNRLASLPNAMLAPVLTGLGHMAVVQAPERFLDPLNRFLKRSKVVG